MLVLALLTERESYGHELVTRLQADGLADMAAGTVTTTLARTNLSPTSDSGPVEPTHQEPA